MDTTEKKCIIGIDNNHRLYIYIGSMIVNDDDDDGDCGPNINYVSIFFLYGGGYGDVKSYSVDQ